VRRQILLVGDSGVGKSSLLMRFTADQFEDSSAPTIGAPAQAPPWGWRCSALTCLPADLQAARVFHLLLACKCMVKRIH